MSWIQIGSGRHFNFKTCLEEKDDIFSIQDIANALSNICRFGGHTPRHYSVAEHSILGSLLVPDKDKLAFLLHDATEAYIGDMVKPLKDMPDMAKFKSFEEDLQQRIFERFGLDKELPESVKKADVYMLAIESKTLMNASRKDWRFIYDVVDSFRELEEGRNEWSNLVWESLDNTIAQTIRGNFLVENMVDFSDDGEDGCEGTLTGLPYPLPEGSTMKDVFLAHFQWYQELHDQHAKTTEA